MPQPRPLTSRDVDIMENLYNSDQHHLAYSYYAYITGSNQAAFQSQISDPETQYGQIAMEANRRAKSRIEEAMGIGTYPSEGL
jgi:hypothetical protein